MSNPEKIALLTDSCADLTPAARAGKAIYVVPLRIRCRDREYSDGVDIFASDIYRRQGLGELPQTSLPDFFDVGRTLSQIAADGYRKVIAVHLSSGLSGTYNMIRLQGESREDLEVKVFDSVSGALGIGITILQLWEDIQGGMGWRELVDRRVPGLIAGTFPFFSVDTLEYLAKGGRIGKVTAMAGTMLNIKPLITFAGDGQLLRPAVRAVRAKAAATQGSSRKGAAGLPRSPAAISAPGCQESHPGSIPRRPSSPGRQKSTSRAVESRIKRLRLPLWRPAVMPNREKKKPPVRRVRSRGARTSAGLNTLSTAPTSVPARAKARALEHT